MGKKPDFLFVRPLNVVAMETKLNSVNWSLLQLVQVQLLALFSRPSTPL
jgi:hypothetical protein